MQFTLNWLQCKSDLRSFFNANRAQFRYGFWFAFDHFSEELCFVARDCCSKLWIVEFFQRENHFPFNFRCRILSYNFDNVEPNFVVFKGFRSNSTRCTKDVIWKGVSAEECCIYICYSLILINSCLFSKESCKALLKWLVITHLDWTV